MSQERRREERASRAKVSGAIIIFKKERKDEGFLSRAFCFSTLFLYHSTVSRELSEAQIFTGSH